MGMARGLGERTEFSGFLAEGGQDLGSVQIPIIDWISFEKDASGIDERGEFPERILSTGEGGS